MNVGGTALYAPFRPHSSKGLLGWGRNRRRPLVGEYRKAQMDDGCDDGADDRGQNIQPRVAEIARHDHRAQRPRRVEGGAGQRPAHQDVEDQGQADRDRREVGARPATAVLSTTVTRKKASTASTTKPIAGVIVTGAPARTRPCASSGVPRPVATPPSTIRSNSAAATPPAIWPT